MSPASSSTVNNIPLKQLANHANSYAAAHGLQIEKRIKTDGDDKTEASSSYQCAPISLLPNAFPSTEFQRAKSLASSFNELVDRISRDGDFLQQTLGGPGGVTDADPYTRKLLELYNNIYLGKGTNGESWGKFARVADRLGVQRSDYMLNSKENNVYELKQVELNTIASSFAGLSVNVAGLHRHLTQRFKKEVVDFIEANERAVMGEDYSGIVDGEDNKGVPVNPALSCIPQAMNVAHEQYLSRFSKSDDNKDDGPVVLFVVQEGETNTVDQRFLEFNLWEKHNVPVVRMSLTAAHTMLELDESTGSLYIKSEEGSKQEVSVVYYRAGYSPADYPDGDDGIEWLSREKIERSRATKCPCLGYHLAGTKKVQQELARPGTLERFFGKEEEKSSVDGMRGAFAGLYSLGSDATAEDIDAVRDALSGGEGRYVLKPQREGGGYNFYGQNLVKKLRDNVVEDPDTKELTLGSELAEFILMERLFPPQQKAILLRAGLVEGVGETISELGCFGTIVATADGSVLHNEYSGFLLRTKFSGVDEGGVASGFATLSSPSLC